MPPGGSIFWAVGRSLGRILEGVCFPGLSEKGMFFLSENAAIPGENDEAMDLAMDLGLSKLFSNCVFLPDEPLAIGN